MRSKTCPFMSFGLLLLILSGLRPENWALPIFEGRFNFKFQYLWYFGPQQCVCIYIYIHTHSLAALLISAHSPLTHSPSHCRPKFCYRRPKLSVTHSRSTLTVCSVLFLFALCLSLQNHFILYIYIYILYSIWDVCFIWIPFAQQRYEESHNIIAKYPNQVPNTLFVSYYFCTQTKSLYSSKRGLCWFILF